MNIEIHEIKRPPTICLNMIVKNESKIITRLLESVYTFIDCYCICDTGSTDNTIEIITDFFKSKNIFGKIIVEPFKNFAYNRSFSLSSCIGMSDYVLLLDADMIFEINNFNKEKLNEGDSFCILQGNETFYHQNMRIVKNNGLYSYVGVTHEYINTPYNNHNINLSKNELFIRDIGDGGCKSDKFERDILLLEKGIQDEPNNVRYHFYLANSYKDCGKFDKAIEYYKKRISLGDWEQEIWYSYFNIGNIYEHLGNMSEAIYYWMEAYNIMPNRLENLHKIINHYRHSGKYNNAKLYYELAKKELQTNFNKDTYLFLHNDVYTYKLDYEYSIIASYLGINNINDNIVNIFNNCDETDIINNTLSNMKFYNFILKPTDKIDLSFTEERIIGEKLVKFNSSSSCIIHNKNKDGYLFNIRLVNYRIDSNGCYHECDKHIITNNKYVEFSKDFKQLREKFFDIEYKDKRYLGIEDIRIYPKNNHTDEYTFIGASEHSNGQIGILIGDYDVNTKYLNPIEIKPNFCESWCEKNWVYFTTPENENRIVYKWFPLQICNINKDSQTLELLNIKDNIPKIFKHARGSTCGASYNNEIWFILHLVSYETPRHYYHFFAVFDKNMNFLRHSAPFKFEGICIEYTLGLIIENERVITSYSTMDGTTNLVTYDKKYIDNLIIYM